MAVSLKPDWDREVLEIVSRSRKAPIVIDLSSPHGNVYWLGKLTTALAAKKGMNSDAIVKELVRMGMSGNYDYEDVLDYIERTLPGAIEFINDPRGR